MGFPAPFIDQPLLSGASLIQAVGAGGVTLGGARDVTIYVNTSNATVSAGVVTIEEADDAAYAGTWSVIQAVTPVQNSNIAVHLSGVYKALRTRISTAVTGGATVSTRIVAGMV
jgi:hypothetical protein